MANEFYYSVSLSIVHPNLDPAIVSKAIDCLRPRIEAKAGTERRSNDGSLVLPVRRTLLTHWMADLHDAEQVYSGDIAISDLIAEQLVKLAGHKQLFSEIKSEGTVSLRIGWFSITNHSAGVLDYDLLRQCGELGLDIELNYYGAPRRAVGEASGAKTWEE